MDNLEFKNIVLEPLRQVRLGISEKKLIAEKYDSVSAEDKQSFNSAIGAYEGIVQRVFIDRLYDIFVYSLNSEDEDGERLIDYLKDKKGFKEKRISSFSIKTEEEKHKGEEE